MVGWVGELGWNWVYSVGCLVEREGFFILGRIGIAGIFFGGIWDLGGEREVFDIGGFSGWFLGGEVVRREDVEVNCC